MDLYRENLLDHYKNPRNFGTIEKADISHHEYLASCGDDITIFVKLGKDRKITDVKFQGKGCAISQASASMLTERIKGMSLDELHSLTTEDIFGMLGTEIGPGRIKCALLPLKTLMKGVEEWESGHKKKGDSDEKRG